MVLDPIIYTPTRIWELLVLISSTMISHHTNKISKGEFPGRLPTH
jgi:hypothetical protein